MGIFQKIAQGLPHIKTVSDDQKAPTIKEGRNQSTEAPSRAKVSDNFESQPVPVAPKTEGKKIAGGVAAHRGINKTSAVSEVDPKETDTVQFEANLMRMFSDRVDQAMRQGEVPAEEAGRAQLANVLVDSASAFGGNNASLEDEAMTKAINKLLS